MDCGICLRPVTDASVVFTTCDHIFCGECLSVWVQFKLNQEQHGDCPLCRHVITPFVIDLTQDDEPPAPQRHHRRHRVRRVKPYRRGDRARCLHQEADGQPCPRESARLYCRQHLPLYDVTY